MTFASHIHNSWLVFPQIRMIPISCKDFPRFFNGGNVGWSTLDLDRIGESKATAWKAKTNGWDPKLTQVGLFSSFKTGL